MSVVVKLIRLKKITGGKTYYTHYVHIPAKIVKALGLKPGDEFTLSIADNKIVLHRRNSATTQ